MSDHNQTEEHRTPYLLDQSLLTQHLTSLSPKLYLGSLEGLKAALVGHANSFTHVLSCVGTHPDLPEHMIHQTVKIEADPLGESSCEFQKAVNFIDEAILSGGTVVVHCELGHSRSPAVITAYLAFAHRLRIKEALELLHSKTATVQINPWILGDLKRWAVEQLYPMQQREASPKSNHSA